MLILMEDGMPAVTAEQFFAESGHRGLGFKSHAGLRRQRDLKRPAPVNLIW
jgi:hypothetical protein